MDEKQGRFFNFQYVIVVLCLCIDFAFVLRAYLKSSYFLSAVYRPPV